MLTLQQAQRRAVLALGRQIEYDQSSSDPHGQSDGSWRSDCSGLMCAIFQLPTGLYCPSTSELTSSFVSGPIRRADVVPGRTVSMVTNSDGFDFGHVALIVAVKNDQFLIQEHGHGTGPYQRWLPAGINYDSDRIYGQHRNFQLYNMLNVEAEHPTTNTPGGITMDDEVKAAFDALNGKIDALTNQVAISPEDQASINQATIGAVVAAVLHDIQRVYNQNNVIDGHTNGGK